MPTRTRTADRELTPVAGLPARRRHPSQSAHGSIRLNLARSDGSPPRRNGQDRPEQTIRRAVNARSARQPPQQVRPPMRFRPQEEGSPPPRSPAACESSWCDIGNRLPGVESFCTVEPASADRRPYLSTVGTLSYCWFGVARSRLLQAVPAEWPEAPVAEHGPRARASSRVTHLRRRACEPGIGGRPPRRTGPTRDVLRAERHGGEARPPSLGRHRPPGRARA